MRLVPRVGVEPASAGASPGSDAGFERGLSHARLLSLLHYSPRTGKFTWIAGRNDGLEAGTNSWAGYRVIRVDGIQYRAHRLAWFYMTGSCPVGEIDHRNTIRNDNRFRNLRDTTNAVNQQNRRRALRRNRTGLLGVSRVRDTDRFKASIHSEGRDIHLGCFDDPNAAHAAYLSAKRELHAGCTL